MDSKRIHYFLLIFIAIISIGYHETASRPIAPADGLVKSSSTSPPSTSVNTTETTPSGPTSTLTINATTVELVNSSPSSSVVLKTTLPQKSISHITDITDGLASTMTAGSPTTEPTTQNVSASKITIITGLATSTEKIVTSRSSISQPTDPSSTIGPSSVPDTGTSTESYTAEGASTAANILSPTTKPDNGTVIPAGHSGPGWHPSDLVVGLLAASGAITVIFVVVTVTSCLVHSYRVKKQKNEMFRPYELSPSPFPHQITSDFVESADFENFYFRVDFRDSSLSFISNSSSVIDDTAVQPKDDTNQMKKKDSLKKQQRKNTDQEQYATTRTNSMALNDTGTKSEEHVYDNPVVSDEEYSTKL